MEKKDIKIIREIVIYFDIIIHLQILPCYRVITAPDKIKEEVLKPLKKIKTANNSVIKVSDYILKSLTPEEHESGFYHWRRYLHNMKMENVKENILNPFKKIISWSAYDEECVKKTAKKLCLIMERKTLDLQSVLISKLSKKEINKVFLKTCKTPADKQKLNFAELFTIKFARKK